MRPPWCRCGGSSRVGGPLLDHSRRVSSEDRGKNDETLPSTGTDALDAIVSYQLCSVPFDREYRDDSPRENRYDLRAWALFLSASVYVVSSYLRQGYLEAGVTDEQAEALLGGRAVTSLRARIEGSDELLRSVKEWCGEPFLTFMR